MELAVIITGTLLRIVIPLGLLVYASMRLQAWDAHRIR
jgi:hypothetical protein